MFAKAFRPIVLLSLLLTATLALAQEGHPAKGTWVGHWGPTLTSQSRIVLVMDHDGQTLSGLPGTCAARHPDARRAEGRHSP